MSDGPRSYYGNPVIKEPIWKPEIPWYLFAGGLGGASAGLAWLTGRSGNHALARRAWLAALAGTGVSPVLLIRDLGKPRRFLYMLRMLKVTSPMSVGSWVLAGAGGATGAAALDALLGDGTIAGGRRRRHRRLRRALALAARPARPTAALLGLPLSTYTGALLAQTAVPVWHEARRELPALFAAGAAASAGAAATALTRTRHAGAARRLAVVGAAAELVIVPVMEHRLDELAEPYHHEAAAAYAQLARGLTIAGALLIAGRARESRTASIAGGALVLAGAACERWSVFEAGFQSARDPRYTVGPQRTRIAGGRTRGPSRRVVPAGAQGARPC
jgi:formate-dependent nitrite reductase membrane component NrfD